jgi:hypothetical protein
MKYTRFDNTSYTAWDMLQSAVASVKAYVDKSQLIWELDFPNEIW